MRSIIKSTAGDKNHGFTLVELLVAIAVVGILTSLAVPRYVHYIEKQRRVDAHHLLLENRSRLTRCFTFAGSYTDCRLRTDSKQDHYTLNTNITATTWTLSAVPAVNSKQVGDTDCTAFTLNNLGERSATGDAAEQCWY